MSDADFTLHEDARGRLQLRLADGRTFEGVVPVRAFPLGAPEEFIGLVANDGHEVLHIPRLADLPEPTRELLARHIRQREFVPRIEAIESCTAFATPTTWTVRTDRGRTELILKAEEDIRRLGQGRLLVTNSHGLHFEVADLAKLDATSRRILARFM
ncbi:MAG: DUF1854 domain-containing protein [Gammaproteobacteria bacterium]|jgi:hypothetical protein|nr:DUF1854 domain-containing protein [Gammaproteobacteria bacterium]